MTAAEIYKRRVEIFLIGVLFCLNGFLGIFKILWFAILSSDPVYFYWTPFLTSIFWIFSGITLGLGLWLHARWARIATVITGFFNAIIWSYLYIIQVLPPLKYNEHEMIVHYTGSIIERIFRPRIWILVIAEAFILVIIYMLGQKTKITLQRKAITSTGEKAQPFNRARIVWGVIIKYLIIVVVITLVAKGIDIFVTGFF
jgi:hypothetical protein